jgi:hypothetical protein
MMSAAELVDVGRPSSPPFDGITLLFYGFHWIMYSVSHPSNQPNQGHCTQTQKSEFIFSNN